MFTLLRQGSRRRYIARQIAALPVPDRCFSGRKRHFSRTATERAGHRWREILSDLGGIFSAAGSHLGTRLDLLPSAFCRQLADPVLDSSPASITLETLHRELGDDRFGGFIDLKTLPQQAHALHQRYRVWLKDGTVVDIKRVRTELMDQKDFEHLTLLEAKLTDWSVVPEAARQISQALALARADLERQLDLTLEGEALQHLRRGRWAEVQVPALYDELSNSQILTTEAFAFDAMPRGGTLLPQAERDSLARRLCQTWLQMVLLEGCLPLADDSHHLVPGSDSQIAWLGSGLRKLDTSEKELLLRYLAATAAHDPGRAYACLLEATRERSANENLYHRLRQLQPLLAGATCGDQMAEYLLMHQQLIAEVGWSLEVMMIVFYRSLGVLQGSMRQLDPSYDPLRAAFEEMHFDLEIKRWRQRLEPGQLGQDLQSCFTLLTELPGAIEKALTMAENQEALEFRVTDSNIDEQRASATRSLPWMTFTTVATAVLLAFTAIAPELKVWSEAFEAVMLIVLGGSLARALGLGWE